MFMICYDTSQSSLKYMQKYNTCPSVHSLEHVSTTPGTPHSLSYEPGYKLSREGYDMMFSSFPCKFEALEPVLHSGGHSSVSIRVGLESPLMNIQIHRCLTTL